MNPTNTLSADAGARAAILLVDDSETDVLFALEALKAAGAGEVHVVVDGLEALDFLRGQGSFAGTPRPGLVFLDLNMPRMSGYEVLAAMKTDPQLAMIPVVVMSTSRSPEDVREAYRLHGNCYVAKPMDVDEFTATVRDLHHFWLGIATLPPP